MSSRYNTEEDNQVRLFSDIKTWEKEWKGMPEFVQKKQKPFQEIVIRFSNKDDLHEFSKLIDQKITTKTKSIWYPELERGEYSDLIYVDEE